MTGDVLKTIALILMALGGSIAIITHPKHNQTYIYVTIKPTVYDTIYLGDTTMGFAIESLMGPIGGIIGAGAEYFGAQSQYDYQRKLMQEQELAGQRMGRFNQGLALEMWDKTNFPAQVEQMKKAGLNPGLMYKGAGPGGSTNISPGAMPSTSGAPRPNYGMAIQTALQVQLQQAQIESIKADTNLKNKQASGVEATTAKTWVETGNAQIDGTMKQIQTDMARIDLGIKGGTAEATLTQIKANAEKAVSEAKLASNQNDIATSTKWDVIQQAAYMTASAHLRVELEKAGLIKVGADTNLVNKNIDLIAKQITNIDTIKNQRDLEILISAHNAGSQRLLANIKDAEVTFNTSLPKEIGQWSTILGDLAKFVIILAK